MDSVKCELCGKIIESRYSNNGKPLVEGRVCNSCNWKVIRERLRLANKNSQSSTESMAVLGTDSCESTVDPIADFEKYAKQFEETFILGDTPVRKESPENKIRVDKNGQFTGEIDSMERDSKAVEVEPIKEAGKSATESVDRESARPNTRRVLDQLNDEVIDSKTLSEELLMWMSDDEVGRFARDYGYIVDIEDEE